MTGFLQNIPRNLQEILQKAGLETSQELIQVSFTTLKNLGISSEDIQKIRNAIVEDLNIKSVTVDKLIESNRSKWATISFGCTSLDSITKAGVTTRGITEITGESGAGKTQILLQLCLMVQLPEYCGGLNKGAVFICTEDPFPSKRLCQLIESFQCRHQQLDIKYADNIFVEHIIETDNLLKCVSVRLPNLLKSKKIGLIVIDSVAAIFRTESNIVTRANDMRKLATSLLNLADTYNCAVVCVNQVTSVADNNCSNKLVPCLGLAWASLVRTRLQIWKTPMESIYKNKSDEEFSCIIRKLEVLFSPDFACNASRFLIAPDGIVDVT